MFGYGKKIEILDRVHVQYRKKKFLSVYGTWNYEYMYMYKYQGNSQRFILPCLCGLKKEYP